MSQLADELMRKYLARERAANRSKSPSAEARKAQRFLDKNPSVARIKSVPSEVKAPSPKGFAKSSLAMMDRFPNLKNIKKAD